jgi:PAS domain S-box-containing protein
VVLRHPFDPDAYRHVFDNAPIGIYRTTPDGRILFANPKALEILGYDSVGELAERNLERDGLHADYDRAEFKRMLEERGELANLESTWRRRDGTVVCISENARAVRGPDGAVFYDGTIEDITERVRAEALLKEGRELYQHIVENATDIVYRTDAAGRFTFINARGLERIGYSEAEVVGQHFLMMIAPDHRPHADQLYRRQFSTRTPSTYHELPIVSKSGERIWVGQNVQMLFDGGRVTGFQAVARDISERRATELELARARDAAIESARLKSEFLANISHEIRTPMNGVIGMTNLLLGTGLDMQQYEYAQMIRSSAEALLTVVNNVLDLSKIEAGKLTLDMVDFDLDDVVESVLELFAERAATKNLRLRQIVYPDVPRSYRGDATRLRQVLLNLVGNAVKFTHSGEVSLSVMRQSEGEEGVTLWFLVADTGIGIAEEVQPRLFSAFTQADGTTTRQYGGTGLGLAISKELVELMGGRIGMASHVGEGSTFWFTIELERNREGLRTRRSYDLAGTRLLLVDHNPVNRLVLRRQLTSAAIEVYEAENVEQATDMLWSAAQLGKPYALAVVEMQMPDAGGLELARVVRGNPAVAETKLLLLTAVGRRKSDHEAFREAGFDAFLLKPVRQPVLLKTIAGLTGDGGGAAHRAAARRGQPAAHPHRGGQPGEPARRPGAAARARLRGGRGGERERGDRGGAGDAVRHHLHGLPDAGDGRLRRDGGHPQPGRRGAAHPGGGHDGARAGRGAGEVPRRGDGRLHREAGRRSRPAGHHRALDPAGRPGGAGRGDAAAPGRLQRRRRHVLRRPGGAVPAGRAAAPGRPARRPRRRRPDRLLPRRPRPQEQLRQRWRQTPPPPLRTRRARRQQRRDAHGRGDGGEEGGEGDWGGGGGVGGIEN